jgi:4-oxalocrotonate tautomerase
MPLARIDLVQGKSAEYRRTIGTIVYEAMVDVLTVPKNDRFQIIAEHPDEPFGIDDQCADQSWRR